MDDAYEKVRLAIAEHDAAHPRWKQEARERREREAEATKSAVVRTDQSRAVQLRAEQQAAAANSAQWQDYIEQRIAEHIKHWIGQPGEPGQNVVLLDVMAKTISDERAGRRKEIKTAVDQAMCAVDAKLEAAERRISYALETVNERIKHAAELSYMASQQSSDQRSDVGASLEAARQELKEIRHWSEAALAAAEERLTAGATKEAQRAVERERLAADQKLDVTTRALSQRIGQVAEEGRRAVEARLAATEERVRAATPQAADEVAGKLVQVVAPLVGNVRFVLGLEQPHLAAALRALLAASESARSLAQPLGAFLGEVRPRQRFAVRQGNERSKANIDSNRRAGCQLRGRVLGGAFLLFRSANPLR